MFSSYYIYIKEIPPQYNVPCNAWNCFTISLWSPSEVNQGKTTPVSPTFLIPDPTRERAEGEICGTLLMQKM